MLLLDHQPEVRPLRHVAALKAILENRSGSRDAYLIAEG
jgi:hypothetical protein